MKFNYDYRLDSSLVSMDLMDAVRDRAIKDAVQHFEANRVPGVAYDNGSLVERDKCFYIEWKPVGFLRP